MTVRYLHAWLFAAIAAAVLSGSPAQARAQATSTRDAAAARALFQEGVACADHRDWSCAADRFHRAHQLRPSPVIAYNLGTALIALGHLVEGAEVLHQVTRDASASAQMSADARRAADAAAPRIGRLTVHLDGPAEGVSIQIDGHEHSSSLHGAAAPIDPGEHAIEAQRDGEIVASARVTIAEAEVAQVSLTIPPLPEPVLADRGALAPPQTTFEDRSRAEERAILVSPPPPSDDGPWIALGVTGGVLVLAGAIVLGVVLAQPAAPAPFDGNLGFVEIGRP